MAPGEKVRTTRLGDVLRIDLVSAETGNAIDAASVRELSEALTSLPEAGVAAGAILADGADFCVGGDHDEYVGMTPDAQAAHWVGVTRLFTLVGGAPVPIVTGVQGRAIGGGCGLAVLSDFLVAAHDARLSFPDVRFGLPVGPGIVQAIVARAGLSHARRLVLLGEAHTGVEAAACGLADASVEAGELEREVLAMAERLARLPARAVRRVRTTLNAAAGDIQHLLEAEVRRRADRQP